MLAHDFYVLDAVVLHQLALEPVRQLQTLYKRFAWVVVPRVMVTLDIAVPVIQIAWIVKPAGVVNVEVVAVARVDVAGIEIQVPSPTVSTVCLRPIMRGEIGPNNQRSA